MKIFRQYLSVFLLCFIGLNLIALKRYDLPYPHPTGPTFDRTIRQNHAKAIEEISPEIVLVGDSTLVKGVDPARLSEQMNVPIYSIGLPGSASTLWYLIIKNNVAKISNPPKYLVIFFRDTMLTMPGYRVQGQYFEQIDEYASPKDELLIERAFINLMNPMERFAEAYVPIYAARRELRDEVESRIRYIPSKAIGCSPECVDDSFTQVFNDENIDAQAMNEAIAAADSNLYTTRALNFENQVDTSFLPELVRIAKESNIKLVLIRIKTLQFPQPFPALDNYINDLKTYAAVNHVTVLDFANDPRLSPDLFMDILHLNEEGKVIFTDILADTLKSILK
jgi:hypothetical protein